MDVTTLNSQAAPHRSFAQVILVFCVSALAFALRIPYWGRPFDMDEGLYAYGAWRMLDGIVVYRDLIDFKPPGVYFLHALNFWLTSAEATNVYVSASLFAAGTTAGVYCVARNVWGKQAGLVSGLLFAVLSSSPYIQGNGANTEVFMLLPYVWSLYFALRAMDGPEKRHYFFCGLLAGLAALFKQTGGVGLVMGLIVILWNTERLRQRVRYIVLSSSILVSAFVLPWLVFGLYFWSHGALGDFAYWVISYPFFYMRVIHANVTWPIVVARVWWVLEGTLPFWLFSTGASLVIVARRSEPKERMMVLFLLLSFLGAVAGWNFYPHYFIQMSPSLALLSGLCFIVLYRYLKKKPSRLLVAAFGCMALAGIWYHLATHVPFYVARSGELISRMENEWSGFGDTFALAKEVGLSMRATTNREDTIFVWMQSPELNFYALRRTPARAPIMSLPYPGLEEILLQDLQRKMPAYLVILDAHALPGKNLSRMVYRHYGRILSLPEPTSGSNQDVYGIYRLKSESHAQGSRIDGGSK